MLLWLPNSVQKIESSVHVTASSKRMSKPSLYKDRSSKLNGAKHVFQDFQPPQAWYCTERGRAANFRLMDRLHTFVKAKYSATALHHSKSRITTISKKKSKTAFQKSLTHYPSFWINYEDEIEIQNHQLSWKAVLTIYGLEDIHNSSPSLSDDVIMSVGTHESRSASIIPRGSSWATWWPRIYRRQEVPPQAWEPNAKPPTRKR